MRYIKFLFFYLFCSTQYICKVTTFHHTFYIGDEKRMAVLERQIADLTLRELNFLAVEINSVNISFVCGF